MTDVEWSKDEPTIREVDLFAKAYGHGDSEAMGELMEIRSNGAVTKSAYLDAGVLLATKWMNGLKDAWDEGMAPYKEWCERENERRQEERKRLEAELKKRLPPVGEPGRAAGSLDDLPDWARNLKLDD